MLYAILAIFSLAIVAPWFHRLTRKFTGWIFALLPLVLFVHFLSDLAPILQGQTFSISDPWIPALGIKLSFYLDGLSLLFVLLITGIGALILIYTQGYLSGHPQLGRFYAYLLMFMGSMLGVVLSDNLITLFVFWELTSVSSYLLIGFNHNEATSRDSALQALLVTGIGGLALLAGFILLGMAAGSFEMHSVLAQGDLIRGHGWYLPILLLVLAGAFTKSAQFPFHFWLPSAMAAPTPVSAYLHSATMVKAGVFLLARLNPVLGGTELWQILLTVFGGATMLVGSYLALTSTDLKKLLAYSTVSSLGIMVFLIGLGNTHAIQAAMAFLLAHALYKGALFMVAGAIDHGTGTRDVTGLGGLLRVMPVTALAAGLAALSMTGFPPLFGFITKEMIYETTQGLMHRPELWTGLALVTSLVLVTVAAMVAVEPFFGKLKPTPKKPHEGGAALWLGPLVLGLISLFFGLYPRGGAQALSMVSSSSILGKMTSLKLVLWHGFNKTLALSALTIFLGFTLYLLRGPLRRLLGSLEKLSFWGPATWYQWSLLGLKGVASFQTRLIQNGYLRFYLMMVIATTVGLTGYTLLTQHPLVIPKLGTDIYPYEAIMLTLIALAALTASLSKARLAAVAALGVVGYGVALIFIIYGAPDLAMTQILIETLVVILLVLGFHHMPGFAFHSSKKIIFRDAVISLAVGGLMTLLVLEATDIRFIPTVWEYYAQNSVPLAHGRNIVNVILVDFRALDTFGEIIVLALAGLGVFALLKLGPKKEEEK